MRNFCYTIDVETRKSSLLDGSQNSCRVPKQETKIQFILLNNALIL